MANSAGRRRHSAFAAGLATMAMALGLAAIPAEAAPPPKVDYVAVGDSYTAGTGAGAFVPQGSCTRTPGGYVDVVGNTGRVNLVANAACHGALLFQSLPGATSVADQIVGLKGAGKLPGETDLISITAGANDLSYGSVLYICAYQPQNCNAALPTQETLDLLRQGLALTYVNLHLAAPDAKIAVLGYPRLFDPTLAVENIDVNPAILAALNGATDKLNETIALAVTDANVGAEFIDVTKRFIGHEANATDKWIFYDGNIADPRAFHPNPAGHSLGYAAALISTVKPAQLVRR